MDVIALELQKICKLRNEVILVGVSALITNLLNSILFSFDGTKLQSPTFPLAKPTANCNSPELR